MDRCRNEKDTCWRDSDSYKRDVRIMKTFLATCGLFLVAGVFYLTLTHPVNMPEATPAPVATSTPTPSKPTETLETQRINAEELKACEGVYATLGYVNEVVRGCYEVAGIPVPAKPPISYYDEELAGTVFGHESADYFH